jgi:hypothetical protein
MSTTQNFETLTVDYLGPLSGHQTYKYILVAIDNHSRFAYMKATKEANNENLAFFLKEIFSKTSFYKKISCDGALCTTHSISRSLVKNLGIELEIGAPTCSRHQGKVERLIRTVNTYLNKYLDMDPSIQWPKIVDMICFLYNSTPKKILGYNSPAQIHYRTAPITYADTILKLDNEKKKDYKHEKSRQQMNEFIKAAEIIKTESLKTHLGRKEIISTKSFIELKPGDLAFKRKTAFKKTMLPKYQKKITDLLRIKSKIGTNLYITEDTSSGVTRVTPADQIIKTNLTLKEAEGILNEKVHQQNEKENICIMKFLTGGKPEEKNMLTRSKTKTMESNHDC